MRRLSIAAADLAAIEAAVRAAFPLEACGILIGRDSGDGLGVEAAVPAANTAPRQEDRFEIDPALLAQTQRALRGSPQRIIGHYHSHPNGIAAPSQADREAAAIPGLVWLILGFDGAAPMTCAAFLHPADKPAPLEAFEALDLVMAAANGAGIA